MTFSEHVLPPQAQEAALANGQFRLLSQSAHLIDPVWEALLARHDRTLSCAYLFYNMTMRRLHKLLRTRPTEEVYGPRGLDDVDLYNSFVIDLAPRLSARTITLVQASGLPHLNTSILERSDVAMADKMASAPHAPRGHRAKWLVSLEADALTDDQAYELLTAPDTMSSFVEGSTMDSDLTYASVSYGALLLHLRPALRARAVESGERWLLAAVSRVRLDTALQDRLLDSLRRHWDGPGRADFNRNLAAGSHTRYEPLEPLEMLATSPWASPAALTELAANPGKVFMEGPAIWVRKESYYGGDRLLLDLTEVSAYGPDSPAAPTSNWLTALNRNWYLETSGSPYVALEAYDRRDLTRDANRVRRSMLTHNDPGLAHALVARKHRSKLKPAGREPFTYTSPTQLERREAYEPTASLCQYVPAMLAAHSLDQGMRYFLSRDLDASQWRVLMQLRDDFAGTIEELAAAAESL